MRLNNIYFLLFAQSIILAIYFMKKSFYSAAKSAEKVFFCFLIISDSLIYFVIGSETILLLYLQTSLNLFKA